MHSIRSLAFLLAAIFAPTAVLAAGSPTSNSYSPPKLVKKGTNKSVVAGAGSVTVQVYVNKDGTFKVQKVIKSTNHGDDQAALEIAQTST